MKDSVLQILNDQIREELYSAYLYLAASAYCEQIPLPGFAHYLRVQSKEEVAHAMKIYEFIIDRGDRVVLQPIEAPGRDFGTPLQIAEKALEHERHITGCIEKIYALAVQEADYPTQVLMQWFINEQVEEEKDAALLVDRLKMIGEHSGAILTLDMVLARRGE